MAMSLLRWVVGACAVVVVGSVGCASSSEDDASGGAAISASSAAIEMTPEERKDVVEKKATCPFVGAAVALKKLDVLGTIANPLARIHDIAALGDVAGGDLGSHVLAVFARGNQHRMHGPDANSPLDVETPPDTFSLDFPPSQGSHPGHSGMLENGSKGRFHGAIDDAAIARLIEHAVDASGRRKGDEGFQGPVFIRRSDIGAFIWDNVASDPESVYLGHGLTGGLASGVKDLVLHPSVEKIVHFSGIDNVIGSCGEFGLLMTFLERPDIEIDGQPVITVHDVQTMFHDRKLPVDWASRPRSSVRWVEHTVALFTAAEGERIADWF